MCSICSSDHQIDSWRGSDMYIEVVHMLNMFILMLIPNWSIEAGDDDDDGWHLGEHDGKDMRRPQLDLNYQNSGFSFNTKIILAISTQGGVQKKKTEKRSCKIVKPPSIYLPTPLGVQKAPFQIFILILKMMYKPLLERDYYYISSSTWLVSFGNKLLI